MIAREIGFAWAVHPKGPSRQRRDNPSLYQSQTCLSESLWVVFYQ